MHAAHLLRKLDPAAWGGTETAIQRLCEGLRAHGVRPIVYCPALEKTSNLKDPLINSGYDVCRYKAFVPVLGLSRERRRQLISVGGNLMSFDLISSLWREEDLSVIHTHTLGRIGGIALTVAKQRQVPFVVSIHGGVFDLPDEMKRNFNAPADHGWEWGKLFGILFRSHRLFLDADAILTCNAREAELLRERLPDKRVLVQPHGVPISLYETDHRGAARAAFPTITGKDLLVCVGRIDPFKNQAWLIEQAPLIFQKHPSTMLVLAGPCTDEPYGRKIASLLANPGLGNRVLLTGGLPQTDPRLIGLLQQARALVLPSRSETFGLVILEGWAAGTVAISSSTSGAKSLIQDGQNGWLFDLNDSQNFHAAVDQVMSNPGLAAAMAHRGAEKVRECYDVHTLAGRMKRLYKELIEENHALRNHTRR